MGKKNSNALERNLTLQITQFLKGKSYLPMKKGELMETLNVAPQNRALFRDLLQLLVQDGEIELKQGRYALPSEQNITQGTISMHPRGFGFVKPSGEPEVFIPKHLTHHAVDGDRVEILIEGESVKGPEGRVLAVLERGRTHIAGAVIRMHYDDSANIFVPALGSSFSVVAKPNPEFKLRVGDRVVLHVLQWGSKQNDTIAEVSHYLGHISDPAIDIAAGCEEFELRLDFPNKVSEEALTFGKRVNPRDMKEREDYRDIETITIDPKTAKDFDDALSISVDKKGNFHLAVHIADVSHYVTPGSDLDAEARLRCNSTYFPGYCLPMLPKELSDNLCSLRPNVNRLTASVLMLFNKHGELTDYEITRSVIRSDKRFSYEEAKEVLDGKRKSAHAKTLKNMVKLCEKLKEHRKKRGSVEFSLPDAVLIVDEHGMPERMEWVDYDITHQMVEEFMLKANEVVARHIDREGGHLPFRIHEEPDKASLEDFATLVRKFGYKISNEPTDKEIRSLFEATEGKPEAKQLAVAYIRSMQLAIYSPENVGHYGLKLEHYCHFTSPIRRYIDLVIHRILFGHTPSFQELQAVSEACSEQERKSARAENQVKLLKKLRLLQKQSQEDPHLQHDAIVTSVKPFGLFFEIADLMLEGFIHISELGSDYYHFDESRATLVGERTGEKFQVGDSLTVMVRRIELITLQTEWDLVSDDQPAAPPRRSRRKKGRKRR